MFNYSSFMIALVVFASCMHAFTIYLIRFLNFDLRPIFRPRFL